MIKFIKLCILLIYRDFFESCFKKNLVIVDVKIRPNTILNTNAKAIPISAYSAPNVKIPII